MAQHIKILEFTGYRRLYRKHWEGPSTIEVDLDILKDMLPDFPVLVELRLTHVATTAPPILTRSTPSRPVKMLVVSIKRYPDDDEDDDNEVFGRYSRNYGLPMFSTLSAVLSVVAPQTFSLKGGYKKGRRDPPESFPAPRLMTIPRLDLGKYWLNPDYLRDVLAPGALEHLTVKWP
ncbi:hypothetical protein C8T65DRAFT_737049 [Cerioporus squamosus]|nr:hypothetical protein C8T65DRAFT_737049 [Cerioporus squamosus]